jgi:transposase InsO family protein
MREHGFAGYQRRRQVRTTFPEPADRKVPDLLNRDFTALASNLRYVGDITYLPLADGNNLYLATVIDCYSRRLAGWSIANLMCSELVTDTLKAAQATCGSLAGAVFHSEHGSVYTSKDYAWLCTELGVTQSRGAVGTSADNNLAESFNATLKREVLQDENSWPSPIDRSWKYSGIMYVKKGTSRPSTTREKTTVRPGNGNRAKALPAIVEITITTAVLGTVNSRLSSR